MERFKKFSEHKEGNHVIEHIGETEPYCGERFEDSVIVDSGWISYENISKISPDEICQECWKRLL